jgi:hypothetical protein
VISEGWFHFFGARELNPIAATHHACHSGPQPSIRSAMCLISVTSVVVPPKSASSDAGSGSFARSAQLCHRRPYELTRDERRAKENRCWTHFYNGEVPFDGASFALDDERTRLTGAIKSGDTQLPGFIAYDSPLSL